MSDATKVTRIYRGFLSIGTNGEDAEVLRLGDPEDDNEWLAETIEEDIEAYGKYLSVRYYITDRSIFPDEVLPEFIKTLSGAGDACYHMCYSEMTGYLYTAEDLVVGGHDLLKELKSHVGKFCHLEISYSSQGGP